MKILLAPNFHQNLDIKILSLLGNSLRKKGHQVEVSLYPISPNINYPRQGTSILEKYRKTKLSLYRGLKYDVVFEINRPRSIFLPSKTIHINWFQDLPPNQRHQALRLGSRDICYLYGSPKFFGFDNFHKCPSNLKMLLSGYAPENEHHLSNQRPYGLNLLGYMSPIWELCREDDGYYPSSTTIRFRKNARIKFYSQIFVNPKRALPCLIFKRPLLNPERYFDSDLFQLTLEKVRQAYIPLSGSIELSLLDKPMDYLMSEFLNFCFVEYPRYKDRIVLLELFRKLFKTTDCIIGGKNWKNYYPYEPNITGKQIEEGDLFKQSVLTVHNNTHGLGLHPRVFEAIQSGSFVLMHKTKNEREYGAMMTALEPNRHFGEYTKEDFEGTAQAWLKNTGARAKGLEEARKILTHEHSWDRRAEQILDDIKNL